MTINVRRTKDVKRVLNIKLSDGTRVKFPLGVNVVSVDEKTAEALLKLPNFELVKPPTTKPKQETSVKDEETL